MVSESRRNERGQLLIGDDKASQRPGNPEIRTLFNLLHGVGLRLSVTPEQVTA